MARESDDTLHVDTSKLHLELSAALEEDVSRKKVDEMKKRAIHTAASYDEFRHMVSCAQLTPVTRKEMETLSDQKRGWHGRSGGVVAATKRSVRNGKSDQKKVRGRQTSSGPAAVGDENNAAGACPLRAPQDCCQFQRDWRRRCSTDEERLKYLRLIGPRKFAVLFRVEMEPVVLGQVLLLVCGGRSPERHEKEHQVVGSTPSTRPVGGPGAGNTNSFDGDPNVRTEESPLDENGARWCVEWLWALTKTGRFAVNILFLEKKERLALARVFGLLPAFPNEIDHEDGPLDSLRKAYAV